MTRKELVEGLVADAVFMARISGAKPEDTISYQAAMLITAWAGVFERIVAQATPYANSTVRRMAAMAMEVITDDDE